MIQETKRSITPSDLHLLTMLTRFDTRLSGLISYLSFSRSFTPTCNIALPSKPVSNVGSIYVRFPCHYNQEKILTSHSHFLPVD